MTVACHSCGSLRGETPFPEHHKRGTPFKCCDCVSEAERQPPDRTGKVITRASDRAALRWRQRQPQLDLVDALRKQP